MNNFRRFLFRISVETCLKMDYFASGSGIGSILKKEAGSGNIFQKSWSRDVEAEAVYAEALRRKKLEAETNSEATNFIRSWKRKQKIFYFFHSPGLKLHAKTATALAFFSVA